MYKTQYIDSICRLKQILDTSPKMSEEFERKLKRKVRLEFNYNSNHLEGNTLTYGQTEMLLFFGKSTGDVPISDLEEMKAHDVALLEIEEMAKDEERPLTEQFIKELNKIILVKAFWKEAITPDGIPTQKQIEIGKYKNTPNSVRLRNGEIHHYASPEETPAMMTDLVQWYNENMSLMHPVQLAAEFHYKFVCIHPFDDGNGRVARLLMNFILLKHNYPPVIIKSADKENYLTALQKADTGDTISLIEYIEKQSIWTLELFIRATKGEDIDEREDIKKEIEILKREKLSKPNVFRTPKVDYEIITHNIEFFLLPLSSTLKEFTSFFSEIKEDTFIDETKIKKKTVTMFGNHISAVKELFGSENKIEYEVFGYDLEEKHIDQIEWRTNMLSLKSASTKVDFKISCTLTLLDSTYKLEGSFNSKSLFEIENSYNKLLTTDETESIIRIVSKHLIKEIRTAE